MLFPRISLANVENLERRRQKNSKSVRFPLNEIRKITKSASKLEETPCVFFVTIVLKK